MGMDVYGLNPKNQEGEYFRNNVWWWRPLWNYCLGNHYVACKVKDGHSNSGDGLDAKDSLELGLALLNDIANGKVHEYEDSYRKYISELPLEECKYCQGIGIRTDKLATQTNISVKELSPENIAVLAKEIGWCAACDGDGQVSSFEANYPFNSQNVALFAKFLINCGGFIIC
jgi:hypothetical protein